MGCWVGCQAGVPGRGPAERTKPIFDFGLFNFSRLGIENRFRSHTLPRAEASNWSPVVREKGWEPRKTLHGRGLARPGKSFDVCEWAVAVSQGERKRRWVKRLPRMGRFVLHSANGAVCVVRAANRMKPDRGNRRPRGDPQDVVMDESDGNRPAPPGPARITARPKA